MERMFHHNSRGSAWFPALTNEDGERKCSAESLMLVFPLRQWSICRSGAVNTPTAPAKHHGCNSQKDAEHPALKSTPVAFQNTKPDPLSACAVVLTLLSATGEKTPVKLLLPPACFQHSGSRFCNCSLPILEGKAAISSA